jgi:glycosyltransferase involved in cell wall biosynthesis
MRVLHVIPSVSPVHGGPSQAILDIERALSARGIDVTTVTTDDDGDNRKLKVPCWVPVATPYATRWYFPRTTQFFKVSIGLGRWLRKNLATFDIVHSHALFSFAPVVSAFIAQHTGVPYVLRPLGVLANYGMTKHHPTLKRISFAMIERRLIRQASAVHFTSLAEQTEAELLGLNCQSVVIPLGVDVTMVPNKDRAPVDERAPLNLLFLSRIEPKKNLENLLQALRLVRAKKFDVTLSIAGDGSPNYVASLQSLARKLEVAAHVDWLGYVDRTGKSEILGAASAFVLPSYSENFGIAVMEALAAGLPCLVARGVALSTEVEKAGAGILIGTSPDEIAAGIEKLVRAPGEIAGMSAAASALASNSFSLDTMGQRLEALYRSILAAEPRGSVAVA